MAVIKKGKTRKPSELELKVLALFDSEVFVNEVRLTGLTSVEVTTLLPNEDKATVRWILWDLRKRGMLRDTGETRALKKGQRPSPVFVKVVNVDIP